MDVIKLRENKQHERFNKSPSKPLRTCKTASSRQVPDDERLNKSTPKSLRTCKTASSRQVPDNLFNADIRYNIIPLKRHLPRITDLIRKVPDDERFNKFPPKQFLAWITDISHRVPDADERHKKFPVKRVLPQIPDLSRQVPDGVKYSRKPGSQPTQKERVVHPDDDRADKLRDLIEKNSLSPSGVKFSRKPRSRPTQKERVVHPDDTRQLKLMKSGIQQSYSKVLHGTNPSRHIQEDDEDWSCFLRLGKKKIVKRLLQKGALPKQRTLDEICFLFGRKSKLTLRICKAICENIKAKHQSIINVWAAYTQKHLNKITFVVCLQKEVSTEHKGKDTSIRLHKIIEYSFIKRITGEYSHESIEIMNRNVTSERNIDDNVYSNLKDCVAKYSVEVMKKHKYLSIVSASSNRSTGYGSNWRMKQEYCIVLYVHTKHYIPVNEEPFKTHYDGIQVDVREGAFIPFGRTATEFMEHVQMGSQIRGEVENGQYVEGTLGCFIDHPQYGLCGLTCAHVVLSPWELLSLKSAYNGTLNWPLHGLCKKVYQPANQMNDIGHTVQLVHKEGSENSSGMEVALFKLTSRHPKSSDFPDASVTVASSATMNINYEHWRICSAERLNSKMRHVVKFGSKTELRDGIIEFDIVAVKELNFYPLAAGYACIKLHKQIEVKPKTPGESFADKGDSGALVFLVGDNSSEHTCIGIVEGGTSYGTVVVSPIVPILQELKVSGLKNFDSEQALSQVHGKIENVGNYLGHEVQTVRNEVQTLTSEVQRISGDIQTIRSEIQGVQTMGSNVQQIQQMLGALLRANQSSTSLNT